jgi:hypothetical protein
VADFIAFTAGINSLLNNGLPATCYFLLSSQQIVGGGLEAGDTLVGGVGEISGTGYARQSQAEPSAAGEQVVFAMMSWSTGAATDWPSAVHSVVLATTVDNSGVALCAWHLQAGGAARNMSGANTTLQFTPTLVETD